MSDYYVEERDVRVLEAIAEYGPTNLKSLLSEEKAGLDMGYGRMKKAGRRLRNAGYAEWATKNPWTIVVTDEGRAKLDEVSEHGHSVELHRESEREERAA